MSAAAAQLVEMDLDPLAEEEEAFRRQRDRLLECCEGEFVALHRGRVVAQGRDDEDLARRMFERLGDEPFLIARVEREPSIYDLPSPEVLP